MWENEITVGFEKGGGDREGGNKKRGEDCERFFPFFLLLWFVYQPASGDLEIWP